MSWAQRIANAREPPGPGVFTKTAEQRLVEMQARFAPPGPPWNGRHIPGAPWNTKEWADAENAAHERTIEKTK